jgi:hypothetical protein
MPNETEFATEPATTTAQIDRLNCATDATPVEARIDCLNSRYGATPVEGCEAE